MQGLLRDPLRDKVEVLGTEFLDKLSRPVQIKQEIVNRRLPVFVHGIRKHLSLPSNPCHISAAWNVEFLHDLFHPTDLLNRDGVRNQSCQIWNGPSLNVERLPSGRTRAGQKSAQDNEKQ